MRQHLSIIISVMLLQACNDGGPDGARVEAGTVDEGHAEPLDPETISLGFDRNGSGDSDGLPITLCNVTGTNTSVVVAQVASTPLGTLWCDESEPKFNASWWSEVEVDVVLQASGDGLTGERLSVVQFAQEGQVAMDEYHVAVGDTLLLSLRAFDGDWFVTESLYVDIYADATSPAGYESIDLPTDWPEMKRQAKLFTEEHESRCPLAYLDRRRMSDEEFAEDRRREDMEHVCQVTVEGDDRLPNVGND